MNKIIVSESVSYGHPDKIADQIADYLLDELLKIDPNTKSGIEVLIKDNIVVLGGEIKTNALINYDECVKDVVGNMPFSEKHNLKRDNIKVINLIGKQSIEINKGVEQNNGIIGAGDQGFMVGYASNETSNYMPLGVYLSKKLCDYVVNGKHIFNLGPDCKSQVAIIYDEYGNPISIDSILVSTMHTCDVSLLRKYITKNIFNNNILIDGEVFNKFIKNKKIDIKINPCGSWEIGGSVSDCGVTGRKIVVDQFGGYCNVGGGAFSGKDSSKVDRSAAYMCRYLAKNIVASGISNTAKIELSYVIGVPEPSSINIELDKNTELIPKIIEFIKGNINLTPKGIIDKFKLTKPIFYETAKYGHYGNDKYPWEKLDIDFTNIK